MNRVKDPGYSQSCNCWISTLLPVHTRKLNFKYRFSDRIWGQFSLPFPFFGLLLAIRHQALHNDQLAPGRSWAQV